MKKYYFLLLFVFCVGLCRAQQGFFMPDNVRQIEIPFRLENNIIIMDVLVNAHLQLKFIFDTGAEHTIITKKVVAEMLNLKYSRRFQLIGSDMKTEVVAYLVNSVRLDIPGLVAAPRENVLVLDQDYFRFEEYAGIEVHGILSAAAFSKYIIKINYEMEKITLVPRLGFKPPTKDFSACPMEVFHNKPFIITDLQLYSDTIIHTKLLLDTGAGLPLLLLTGTQASIEPREGTMAGNIAMGLGGFLEGHIGKGKSLTIGEAKLDNIPTYFQEMDSLESRPYLNGRHGIIGNILLKQFDLILDYNGEMLYVRPLAQTTQYKYDRSGLSLIATGAQLNRFEVHYVLKESPAVRAGILPNDRLVKVGWLPVQFYSLAKLQNLLSGKPGKKIKLTFKRGKKRYKTAIVLEDLLG